MKEEDDIAITDSRNAPLGSAEAMQVVSHLLKSRIS
jgi:hypothetical protein